MVAVVTSWPSVLLFWPKYRLGHPEKYFFGLSKNIFFLDQSIPKNIYLNLKTEALLAVTYQYSGTILGDIDRRSRNPDAHRDNPEERNTDRVRR